MISKIKEWIQQHKIIVYAIMGTIGVGAIIFYSRRVLKQYSLNQLMNGNDFLNYIKADPTEADDVSKQFEGFEPKAYYDGELPTSPNRYAGGKGTITIAWGHTGDVDGAPIYEGQVVDKAKGEQLLADDMGWVAPWLASHVTGEHTKGQWIAMRDFLFHTGNRNSQIWGLINGGASNAVIADWFKNHYTTENGNSLPGLVKRENYYASQWA